MDRKKIKEVLEFVREHKDAFKDGFEDVGKLLSNMVFRDEEHIAAKIVEFESWEELDSAFEDMEADSEIRNAIEKVGDFLKNVVMIIIRHKLAGGRNEE